jgi:arylsulfatase A-like enzyme
MRLIRLIAVAIVTMTTIAAAQTTRPRYNVLFLISDDLRAEPMSFGGLAVTPNIDALGKAGVRFDRAYCQYPLCNPSRSSMLSGRYPTNDGVMSNGGRLRQIHPEIVTLPQFFKLNGYASLRAGKIFHGGIDDPEAWTEGYGARAGSGGAGGHNLEIPPQQVPPQPPDVLPPLPGDIAQRPTSDRIVILDGDGEGNPDYNVATQTIEYLQKYKDQPFFIGCGFAKPHSPPAAPQRFFDLYDLDKIPLTPDFAAWPTVPPGFPKSSIRMLNADLFIGRGASEYEAKQYARAYYASSSWMDWNVGRVLAELDRLNLRDKTIIVFWGDHGYQLGEKGKWSKAGSVWEKGSRVPLIFLAPGAKGNGTPSPRVVESIDIYPTLAELCGLKAPEGIDGHSLVPLLNDPNMPSTRPAFTFWSENGRDLTAAAVRNDDYRYAEFDNGHGGAMLLDEQSDPHEIKNLADDPAYAKVRTEMSIMLKRFLEGR